MVSSRKQQSTSSSPNKKKSKKKNTKNKLKTESALLYFLAYNPDSSQTKKFLKSALNRDQYTVLREIAVNELANNLPDYSRGSKEKVKRENIARLRRLAQGLLKKNNLVHIYNLLKILCTNVLHYHDIIQC